MSLALACIAAVALDLRFGEPRRSHPLVLFGALANRLERHFNAVEGRGWRSHGVTAWCLAVLPLTGIAYLLSQLPYVGILFDILMLYLALGLKSLGQHALPIAQALRQGDLAAARLHLSRIVSRQTEQLEPGEVARGATESVLENGLPCWAVRGWCCTA
jgi:adenosylcobinamide-phosphate synthase